MKKSLLLFYSNPADVQKFEGVFEKDLLINSFNAPFNLLSWIEEGNHFDAVILAIEKVSSLEIGLIKTIKEKHPEVPVIWLAAQNSNSLALIQQKAGIDEIFIKGFEKEDFLIRLNYLIKRGELGEASIKGQQEEIVYPKISIGKRLFDVVFSLGALTALLPLFLIVALLVKIGSKGPVFYYSYRVGTGYRIFKFWKFRSMRQHADSQLGLLKNQNQYGSGGKQTAGLENGRCAECIASGQNCSSMFYDAKGNMICEKLYIQARKNRTEPAFLKIKDDPRITRIGQFIRNTSIDELPQLYNVLIGDMSIVGNRPLPLYEAEKLTTDQFSKRFIAPAGITGLWQVTKRSKGDMSEAERIELDNDYANNYSLKRDIQIILKTFPALFQKENV